MVLQPEGSGQLKGWQWIVFNLKGHKDVTLITFKFRCKGVRYQSYVGSVTKFTRDPTRWHLGLATSVASLATSTWIVWARELLRNFW